MKIEFEMKYPLGTQFYGVESKAKNVYAPCPVCKNNRKIKAFGADGSEHSFDCPRCTKTATKGDASTSITVYTFSIVSKEQEKIYFTPKGAMASMEYRNEISLEQFESTVKNTDNIFDYCHKEWGDNYSCILGKNTVTTDLPYLEALVKASNKAEREKAKDFEEHFKMMPMSSDFKA